ncbi:MAG: DUF4340 domain-containing protein [Oscillospiraceae bacterium]|nr:DUF4340 domain-containing protein [Oscillospiraceae bacterium]
MKRARTLKILLGVLVALIIGTIVVIKIGEYRERMETYEEVVFSFDADKVERFSFSLAATAHCDLTKDKNGIWLLDKEVQYPINQELVEELLNCINNYEAKFKIVNPELSVYGLDRPEHTATITIGGESRTISFGDKSPIEGERYFMVGDGFVYIAKEDVAEKFEVDNNDLMAFEKFPDVKQFTGLRILGANNLDVIYKENAGYCYSDSFVYYTKVYGQYMPCSSKYVESTIDAVWKALTDYYATYDIKDEDLDTYNLREPELTVEISYLDENDEEHMEIVYMSPRTISGAKFFHRVGSKYIIHMNDENYEKFLNASYNTLRPSEMVLADWNTVKQVIVNIDGERATFDVQKDGSKTLFFMDGEEVDLDAFSRDVNKLDYVEFLDSAELKSKEGEIKFIFDNEKWPSMTCEIYKYSGNACVIKVDGRITGTVLREDCVKVIEELNAVILG